MKKRRTDCRTTIATVKMSHAVHCRQNDFLRGGNCSPRGTFSFLEPPVFAPRFPAPLAGVPFVVSTAFAAPPADPVREACLVLGILLSTNTSALKIR